MNSIKIPCVLENKLITKNIWNESLHGLTGFIVSVEKTAWEGYQVVVKLDNPPEWIKGKSNNDLCRCVYVGEDYRDLVAIISNDDMEKLMLWSKGIFKCELCNETLPNHLENCSLFIKE